MPIKIIASAVIAALLLIGATPSAPTEPAITPTAAVQQTAPIVAAEAEAAALAHAKLTADQVSGLRSHYDRDAAIAHWDVDFRAGDWEYDYEISGTGQVLEFAKEYDPVEVKPVAAEPPAQTFTLADAKALALAHAGLTPDQVTGLRAEYDRDDGIPTYEVEFYAGGCEYDYEIHASTGAVLDFGKELND